MLLPMLWALVSKPTVIHSRCLFIFSSCITAAHSFLVFAFFPCSPVSSSSQWLLEHLPSKNYVPDWRIYDRNYRSSDISLEAGGSMLLVWKNYREKEKKKEWEGRQRSQSCKQLLLIAVTFRIRTLSSIGGWLLAALCWVLSVALWSVTISLFDIGSWVWKIYI